MTKPDKKIPIEIVYALADPEKVKKTRKLIDYLKVRDTTKSGGHVDIKVLEHVFFGLRYYLPLVQGIKGGHAELNLEEIVEALEVV